MAAFQSRIALIILLIIASISLESCAATHRQSESGEIDLGIGISPQWSPDGHRLIYLIYTLQDARIIVYDINTHKKKTLVDLNKSNFHDHVEWFSPHSILIALTSNGKTNLLELTLKSGKSRVFCSLPDHVAVSTFSLNSQGDLAYLSVPRKSGTISILRKGTNTPLSIDVKSNQAIPIEPLRWSSDNKRIVFRRSSIKNWGTTSDFQGELWSLDLSSHKVTSLLTAKEMGLVWFGHFEVPGKPRNTIMISTEANLKSMNEGGKKAEDIMYDIYLINLYSHRKMKIAECGPWPNCDFSINPNSTLVAYSKYGNIKLKSIEPYTSKLK